MPDLCLIVRFTLLFVFIKIIFRWLRCAGIFFIEDCQNWVSYGRATLESLRVEDDRAAGK